jgi:hypothetical protein
VIKVNHVEFASLPDVGEQAARMMLLVDEPGMRRMFVNDMFGILYTVSYDGKTVPQGQIFILNKRDGAIRLLVK